MNDPVSIEQFNIVMDALCGNKKARKSFIALITKADALFANNEKLTIDLSIATNKLKTANRKSRRRSFSKH